MQICYISRFLFICLCFCFFVPVAYAQNNAEVSISGTLLMLDDATPHVAVVVQAVTPAADGKGEPQVVATTLSDEAGKYQFTNLKPGRYQVRCYTGNGYVYYTLRQDPDGIVGITEVIFGKEESGDILRIEPGETPLSVDFRFPPFKKGTWKNYTLIDGLAGNAAIYQDPDGVMWFGGGGVSRYDGKEFKNLTNKDGLAGKWNWVGPIHRDPDGVKWFGTWGGGVFRYDGKEFLNFTTKDALTHDTIYCIYRTSDGILWFGTAGGGVCLYDGITWTSLDTRDGLADNTISLRSSVDSWGAGGNGVACEFQ